MIEMLVAMLFAAILVTVAVPLYTSYNTSIRTEEGKAAALNILTAAKVYYYRNDPTRGFTGSGCDCSGNNIWLNTGEICNHWDMGSSYSGSGPDVSFTLTGQGNYKDSNGNPITIQLTFNANTGITSIIN